MSTANELWSTDPRWPAAEREARARYPFPPAVFDRIRDRGGSPRPFPTISASMIGDYAAVLVQHDGGYFGATGAQRRFAARTVQRTRRHVDALIKRRRAYCAQRGICHHCFACPLPGWHCEACNDTRRAPP